MKGSRIGEFEEMILLVIAYLGEAYGNEIVVQLKEKASRKVSLSTVHITLYRLEDKGLLNSRWGEAQEVRGGRRKRYFLLTASGMRELRAIQQTRLKFWSLVPELSI
ncbi:MAG: helix-turn-helix transcriptional regulator [Cyclobacteriaceae bacterium]